MDDDPTHRPGTGAVPSQDRALDHREEDPEVSGWDMGLPSAGDIDTGSGIRRDR